MKLRSDDLLAEFYQKYKHLPEFEGFNTPEELKFLCECNWQLLKNEMLSGECRAVRQKYFGIFKTARSRCTGLHKVLSKALLEGTSKNVPNLLKLQEVAVKLIERHGQKTR